MVSPNRDSIDTRLLLSAPLLLSLGVLAVNDHIAKQIFASALTGKISDFAGLFAFVLFLRALLPEAARTIVTATALGFIFWKSPLSAGVIDLWNSLPFGKIGRVVDYSDLAALVVIPAACFYQPRRRALHPPQPILWLVVLLSMLPLLATTCNRPGMHPDMRPKYGFDQERGSGLWCQPAINVCRKQITDNGRTRFLLTDTTGRLLNDSLFDMIRIYDRAGASWHSVVVEGDSMMLPEFDNGYYRGAYYSQPSDRYLEVNAGGICSGNQCRGGRWGIVDRGGRTILPPRFAAIDYNSGRGVFVVAVRTDARRFRLGLFDTVGSPLLDAYNDSIALLGPGLVRYRRTADRGGKWGVVDTRGRQILPPSIDSITGEIREGRVRYRTNGRWGYLDTLGRVTIEPRYSDAADFSEGHARVRISADGPWGLVDADGRFVAQPVYDSIGDMKEGRAWARRPGEKFGYLDSSGQMIIAPQFDSAGEFRIRSVGYMVGDDVRSAPVRSAHVVVDGRRRQIDRMGSWYTTEAPLPHQLVVIRTNDSSGGKSSRPLYGFMDVSGLVYIEPRFSMAFAFSEGRARVRTFASPNFGFIDSTGAVVIPTIYRQARDFHEGLAMVHLKASAGGNQAGYIDRSGVMVISGGFDSGDDFSFGRAAVAVETSGTTRYGFIDRTGTMVIKPQFDWAEKFTESGVARITAGGVPNGPREVRSGLLWGLIDTAGRIVIEPIYQSLSYSASSGTRILGHDDGTYIMFDNRGRVRSRNRP